MPERPTDEELLRAAASEPASFATFYRRHVPGVLAYYGVRTRDPELATDLTAEVFAAALESVARYDPSLAPPVAWLYGIARNVLRNSLRKGRIEDRARRRLGMEPLTLVDEALTLVAALGSGRREGVLLEQLASLPRLQREAVVARVLDEREYRDIAGELRCSESVVRQRVSRGLATLRSRVQEER